MKPRTRYARPMVNPDGSWMCELCFTKVQGDKARVEHIRANHPESFGKTTGHVTRRSSQVRAARKRLGLRE